MAFSFLSKRVNSTSTNRSLSLLGQRRCAIEPLEDRRMLAVLFADSFEQGSNSNDWVGNWVEDGQNDWFRSTQRATDGVRSAEVDGSASDATLTMASSLDLSGYATAELTFNWLIEKRFDSGEYLALDISSSGGSTWQNNVRQLNGNVDAEYTWHSETIDLTAYASSDVVIRFRAQASRSNEDANVDNVQIVGTLPSGPPEISISDASATEADILNVASSSVFVSAGSRLRYITFGSDGHLYVDGVDTDSVFRYDGETGEYMDEFVSPGSGGLGRTRDMLFDPNGDLLVVSRDDNRIIRYDGLDGSFDTVLVDGTGGLNTPASMIYIEATDELYVSSAQSDEILKYDGQTGEFLGAFVNAGSGGLSNPKWMLFTETGDLLVVSQSSDEILRYDASGNFQGVFYTPVSANTTVLQGMAWAVDGSLLVGEADDLNSGRVIRLDASTGTFIEEYVSVGEGGLNTPRSIITDDDGNLYVVSYETNEVLRYAPGANAAFTVSLSSPSDVPVMVDFATSDVTATAGIDYESVSGTIVFEPGVTQRTIVVPTIDDGDLESTESFTVNLSNASGATIVDAQGTAEIVDNETTNAQPTVNAGDDVTVQDSDQTGSETVTLVGVANDPDGLIISYEWTEGATVLGDTASISPTLPVGTHVLTLAVTDNGGATASDNVTVTVEEFTPATSLYVYDIRFESAWGGWLRRAVVEIRSDSNGDGQGDAADDSAAGVDIEVEFAGQTFTGTTDTNGVFRTSWIWNPGSGNYANVVDLALSDYVWNPALDLEDDSDGDGKPDDLLNI